MKWKRAGHSRAVLSLVSSVLAVSVGTSIYLGTVHLTWTGVDHWFPEWSAVDSDLTIRTRLTIEAFRLLSMVLVPALLGALTAGLFAASAHCTSWLVATTAVLSPLIGVLLQWNPAWGASDPNWLRLVAITDICITGTISLMTGTLFILCLPPIRKHNG